MAGMTARRRLAPVVGGTVAVAAAYGSAFLPGGAPPWAPWAMVAGIALLTVGMMALGAARPGRGLGPLLFPLGFTFVVLVAGFGLALALPGREGAATPLRGGLPTRAALVLYGVGLLPALVLPLAYALTFRSMTLDEADLERIRAARRASPGPGGDEG
jgi:hypothetical protein